MQLILRYVFLPLCAVVLAPGILTAQKEVGRRKAIKLNLEWVTYSSKNFEFQYERGIQLKVVQRVATALEESLVEYARLFKFKPKEKLAVKFLDNMNTYEQVGGDPSHPGFYSPPTRDLFLVQRPYWQLLPTAQHEAFHQSLHRYVGDTDIPDWFNEGMATYFEGMQISPKTKKLDASRIDNRKLRMVRQALITKSHIPLEKLIDATHEEFHGKDKESLHYTQSFAVVYFFMRAGMGKKAFDYVKTLKKTKDPAKADEKLFGKERKNLKKIEKRWRSFTLKTQLTEGVKAS